MKKIINVDDDLTQSYTLKKRLERLGDYEVIGIESGQKCLEWLENHHVPDLILLDIMMPEMSGWQVYKRLRQNDKWKKIPVAFLTAKTDNFSIALGKILSEAYIEKPFEIEELKQKIEEIISTPVTFSKDRERIIEDMIKKMLDSD